MNVLTLHELTAILAMLLMISDCVCWDLPDWKPKGCKSLETPANGNQWAIKSIAALFSCDEGFKLIGSPVRLCEKHNRKYRWDGSDVTCQAIDYCEQALCFNNGTCTEVGDGYTCICPSGFTGKHCETDIYDCLPGTCLPGGVCIDGVNTYTCVCLAGYTGDNCETDINDCEPSLCFNGGTCYDGLNNYTCTCPSGFTGSNCEIDINDCLPDPCSPRGTCVDGVNSYTCVCNPGRTGSSCDQDIIDCIPEPCSNGGICIEGVNSYTCVCKPGYTGHNCAIDIDDCQPNPCHNGGTCIDGVDSRTCSCPPIYYGTNCEQELNKRLARDKECDAGLYYAGSNACLEIQNCPSVTKCPSSTNNPPFTGTATCQHGGGVFHYIHVGGKQTDWVGGTDAMCLSTTGVPAGYGVTSCQWAPTMTECEIMFKIAGCVPACES